ncbi:MAG TPA: tetratricopeptide repeat protein [Candidatus Polarisedimenticolia bacterium]|nr:tetratricopeptide repeat protein [Candidatus Polarisedimenticolia bacterium]
MAATFLLLTACREVTPGLHHADAPAYPEAKSPLSQAEFRTTDGTIAVANLQAQIDGEERLASYGPLSVAQRAGIAELIAMRGQFTGRIADYEQAEQIAERLVREAPDDPVSFLARAQARSTFHRFPEALADLEQAERLGLNGERVESLRAAVDQATGHFAEALAVRQRTAHARPDLRSLGAEASVRADRGDIEEAERLFTQAPHHYRDVSPFPIAWLYFQQGSMWMREGRLERARTLFEAAHQRLPAYAAAQGHLAEAEAALGGYSRAIDLLRPLAQDSDDPDYAAQLARILGEAGRSEDAARWRDTAAKRYDDLIARHPEAFADHAAEFWLGAGNDPGRALKLARMNLTVRRTPRAFELVLQAALAAGDTAVACDAATQAAALPHLWPALCTLTSRALTACQAPRVVPPCRSSRATEAPQNTPPENSGPMMAGSPGDRIVRAQARLQPAVHLLGRVPGNFEIMSARTMADQSAGSPMRRARSLNRGSERRGSNRGSELREARE